LQDFISESQNLFPCAILYFKISRWRSSNKLNFWNAINLTNKSKPLSCLQLHIKQTQPQFSLIYEAKRTNVMWQSKRRKRFLFVILKQQQQRKNEKFIFAPQRNVCKRRMSPINHLNCQMRIKEVKESLTRKRVVIALTLKCVNESWI
jgi:hypothetical protein